MTHHDEEDASFVSTASWALPFSEPVSKHIGGGDQ